MKTPSTLKRFLKDTSGNFAIFTFILLIPLMTAVGAAVDYSRYANDRSNFQAALDAAGLAAARHLETLNISDPDVLELELESYAKNFVEANISSTIKRENYKVELEVTRGNQAVVPATPDTIDITGELAYNTIFSTFVGVSSIEEQLISQISLGNRTVEIALVLDNSGSMRGQKLRDLKEAAKSLTKTVFNSAALSNLDKPVQVSLVPFSGMVNVGKENINANWMDQNGWSPVHHENFDWLRTYNTRNNVRIPDGFPHSVQENINGTWVWKTRHDVYDMLGSEWKGCVEMRPWPHNVLDTAVSGENLSYSATQSSVRLDTDGNGSTKNDGLSALFVPSFAPDEPHDRYRTSQFRRFETIDRYSFPGSYLRENRLDRINQTPLGRTIHLLLRNRIRIGTNIDIPSGASTNTNQLSRQNWVFKYQHADRTSTIFGDDDPNSFCSSEPILPLSEDRDTVDDNIDAMEAVGATNIQQGLTWGWRTLTPAEPFAGGRERTDRRNLKFVVLLTDGANTYYASTRNVVNGALAPTATTPNGSTYGAWGYTRADNVLPHALSGENTHNRLGKGLRDADLQGTIYNAFEFNSFKNNPTTQSQFERMMNAHTNQACENIKDDGITIFTVAFDITQTSVVNLMAACAGSGRGEFPDSETGELEERDIIADGDFYFPAGEGDLPNVFANIARRIANLRIAG